MISVLIIGKNSYIGSSISNFLKKYPNEYQICQTSVRGNSWVNVDWSSYGVVINTTGIAHINPNKIERKLYYDVNYDLAKS